MSKSGPYWNDERVARLVKVVKELAKPAADVPEEHQVIQSSQALSRVILEAYMRGLDYKDEVSLATMVDTITALKNIGLLTTAPSIKGQRFRLFVKTSLEVTGEQVRTAITNLRK